jgi:hypothetical protein
MATKLIIERQQSMIQKNSIVLTEKRKGASIGNAFAYRYFTDIF